MPVGEDQNSIWNWRDGSKANSRFDSELFVCRNPIFDRAEGGRIMSLTDPTEKCQVLG